MDESDVMVCNEIVEALWEEEFTTAEEKHVIEDLREKLRALGLDPAHAKEIVERSKSSGITQKAPTEPFLIQPQKEWKEARKRLDEQAKRTAKILLNNVGLHMNGKEIPHKYTNLNVPANNNFVSALMMVNNEINARLDKERNNCTTEEFKEAIESMPEILQLLVRRLKKAISNYEKQNS